MTTGAEPSTCGQVQLALVLAEAGGAFVVVGGTAAFLRGGERSPRDLDLAVRPTDETALDAALASIGVRRRTLSRALPSPRRVITSWSPVDVFVEEEVPACSEVVVDGVALWVARE